MHLSVHLQNRQDQDFSFALVFEPAPFWYQGSRLLARANNQGARYAYGGVERLLETATTEVGGQKLKRTAVLLVHEYGDGTGEDLVMLQEDLQRNGFLTQTFYVAEEQKQVG